jgi:hypothetical protein
MEARELRIGNLVEYAGKTCAIYAINDPEPLKMEYTLTLWDRHEYIDCMISDIRPIGLYGATLTMLGFYQEFDSAPGIGEYFWWGNDFMTLTNIFASKNLYGVEGVEGFSTNKVHVLQNLAYIVHGKELEWK